MTERTTYFDLFYSFAKVGLFTFGGGYAMIPIIENLCVEDRKWLTPEEMAQTIVISNSTPGPIAINCATYVGYKQRSWLGALATTFGICLPSFVIIFLIALYFRNFLQYKLIASAFEGVNIAVGLLVLQAGIKMVREQDKNRLSYTILGITFLVLLASECKLLPVDSSLVMAVAVVIALTHYVCSGASRLEAQALSEMGHQGDYASSKDTTDADNVNNQNTNNQNTNKQNTNKQNTNKQNTNKQNDDKQNDDNKKTTAPKGMPR